MGNKVKPVKRTKKRSYKSNAVHMNDVKRRKKVENVDAKVIFNELETVASQNNQVIDKSTYSSEQVLEETSTQVESSAAASIHYTPTLWYYKHLNFLSGKKETDSEDSDSDVNDETVYVQLPRGQNTQPTSTDQEEESERDKEESLTTVDASAAAFGRSVGAQLHHLSKMQRCIAEKLISDVIYHAKMEQLTLDTSINVKEAVEDQTAVLIPKAGPSWYEIDLDDGAQESSTSCPLPTDTIDEIARREMEETQSAVNFIKMESDVAENYVFQDYELSEAIDIVKEEIK